MGTTPKYALPFPDSDDAPNVPYDLEQLAKAVEKLMTDRYLDAGYYVDCTAAVQATTTANFTTVAAGYQLRNGFAFVSWRGTTKVARSEGDLNNDNICQWPEPIRSSLGGGGGLTVGATGAVVAVALGNTGLMTLGATASALAAGASLGVSGLVMIA